MAHQSLQRGPLGLELHLLRKRFALGDLLKLRAQLRQFCCAQGESGNAALVINRHRGPLGDAALGVVNGNIITEDRPRIRVHLLDGRAGESDERRVRREFRRRKDFRLSA